MTRLLARTGLLLTATLTVSTQAFALSCDEITNMVNVNVPTGVLVETIEGSGETFTADDIRCLTNNGVPAEIIAAAKKRMGGTTAPAVDESDVPAAPTAIGGKSSDFDSTEAIGDTKGSKELRDLPEEGEESGDNDPQKLEDAIKAYNAKKPLTSSLALFELLQENAYPDKESKILFYLGRSLYDLGMYHSAQYYFIEVLKKGPENPYFKYALPKLVAISKYTGDESDLLRIVAKIPPDEYPRSARNQLYYLLGLNLFENDDLAGARKYFEQISDKSDLYTRAKFLEGEISNQQGRLKSAVRAFTEVVRTEGEAVNAEELKELDNLRDLSLMNIARIYYSIERYQDANTWYGYVGRDSVYWPQAQFESAWSNFMLSDLNLTLGQLLSLQSPYFESHEYVPEATVLRALTFFNLCEFNDVERILTEFNGTYKPVHDEMKDFLKQYSTPEGKKLADQAYDRYFGPKPGNTTIPKPLFTKMLRNQELSGLVTHLDQMEREEDLIDAQKTQWKDGVGENLHKIIAEDRERLKRRAGLVLLQEMVRQANYLGGLLTQAEIIKFEIVDARRKDYIYASSNLDLLDAKQNFVIDFATSPDKIYWPFNGEFWADELGYYRYTEHGSCK